MSSDPRIARLWTRPDNTFTTNDFFIYDSSPLLRRILRREDKYGTREIRRELLASADDLPDQKWTRRDGGARISAVLRGPLRKWKATRNRNWRAATINRELHCLFRADKPSKKISPPGRKGIVACVHVCMCNGVTVGGWGVVVTKGRFLFLHDVSRSATPLYGIYFYIGKKYSRNRERGRKGA